VVVQELVPAGPAARAGLRAEDAILEVDGHPVRTVFDLNALVLEHEPGQQVQIAYERSGERGSCRVLFELLPLTSLASEKVALQGMTCANLTEALGNKLAIPAGAPGVVVVALEPGTPADRLGLQEGDLIYQVEHLSVPNIDGLVRVLKRLERAGSARLLVWRHGARLEGRLVF
jgi:serine protease Do